MSRACVTGITCLAFLWGGFWVLEYGTRRLRLKKVIPVVTTHHKRGIDHVDTLVEGGIRGEDRISQLSDDVISLIVSQLHTKEAVRTSVLSRRWKHVYTFISQVKFCCYRMPIDSPPCHNLKSRTKFVQAVDTFFQHHSGSRITSFYLVCCFRGSISEDFRRWVNTVARLGVERLTVLYGCPKYVDKSNPPIFSSDFLPEASSVKRLYLEGGSFQISSQKALKDLDLKDVTLTSEALEWVLFNCPSLQSLTLKSCTLPSKLHIHGPELKILTLLQCSKVAEINLSAANLTTFHLCTLRMLTLSFSNVPLLQNIFVDVCDRKVAPYVFGKVAEDLPNLKCMYFWTDARFLEAFEIGGVNKLSHLTQLALFFKYQNKLDLLALTTILHACPLLRKFHLSMTQPSTFNGIRAQKRVVRHHTQLKEVEFSGFSMTENEYNFIFYILKSAISLEGLSIFLDVIVYHALLGSRLRTKCNRGDCKEKQRVIRKRLQGHAISKNAKIIIW